MKQEAENHEIRSSLNAGERKVSPIAEESWDGNDSSGSQIKTGRTNTQKGYYNAGGHEVDSAGSRNSVNSQESTRHKEETQNKQKRLPWLFDGAPRVQREPKNAPRSEDVPDIRNVDRNINQKNKSANKEEQNTMSWLFSDAPKSQREPKSSAQPDRNSTSRYQNSSSQKEQNEMSWLFSDSPKSSKDTVGSNSNRKKTLSDDSVDEFQFGQYKPSVATSTKPGQRAESMHGRNNSLQNDNDKKPEGEEQSRRRSSGRRRGQSGKDAADELKRLIEF